MAISEKTIKTIFASSGNLCALCFSEGRQALLVNGNGIVISEIAHIRAKSEGGPRYSESYKDVDAPCNLIPLCCNCHTLIDKDIKKYTTDFLVSLKQNHEEKFTKALQSMATLYDVTKSQNLIAPKNFNNCPSYKDCENRESVKSEYLQFMDKLKNLPPNCRKFLEICLERADNEMDVLCEEISGTASIGKAHIKRLFTILSQYNLISINRKLMKDPTYDIYADYYSLHPFGEDEIYIYHDLKEIAKKKGFSLSVFFEDLDFSSLSDE